MTTLKKEDRSTDGEVHRAVLADRLADSAELAEWADFEEFGSARICAGGLRI